MKYIIAGMFIFSILVLSSLKGTAQGFKFPLLYKLDNNATILNNYHGRKITKNDPADSTKAMEIGRQDDCRIYALPLDGTRCVVSGRSAYQMPNAFTKADANAHHNTIPNCLEIRDIIPRKNPHLLLITK